VIQLSRQRISDIPARYRGAGRIGNEQSLVEARRDFLRDGGGSFGYLESSMWKPAKARLDVEAAGKCGYCEAEARVVAHCDVEHIRPKSVYWWLGLCFDNYVLSCQICNQTHKGDKYPAVRPMTPPRVTAASTAAELARIVDNIAPDPLSDDAGLKLTDFRRAWRGESPGLINPYEENPEPFFAWIPNGAVREVTVAPLATRGRAKTRAVETIEILGLNRPELLRARWKQFRPVNALCANLKAGLRSPEKEDTEEMLREVMADDSPYAAMSRYVVRVVHGLTL